MNVLNASQLKIFRKWLVDCGFYPSYTKAIKATDSHIKCHAIFLQVIVLATDFDADRIADICSVYVVDDYYSDCVSDKVDIIADCVSDKVDTIADCVSNEIHEVNCVSKKVRGKQKRTTLKHYPVRLSVEALEQLRGLGGNVSDHIRLSISQYLDSVLKTSC
jgi:hypothetical protein